MVRYSKTHFPIKNLLFFLIISSFISLSFQKPNLIKKESLRNQEEIPSTSIETSELFGSDTDFSDIPTDTTSESKELNRTSAFARFRPAKKNGLSAGGIIGIVVPCVAVLGGVGAVAALSRKGSFAPRKDTGVPTNFESSMAKFNTNNAINGANTNVKEVKVIQPIEVQQPVYPIKKEIPSVIKVEPVQSINQAVPVHQVIASQNPLITGNNGVKTISQIIPQNTVSQVNP